MQVRKEELQDIEEVFRVNTLAFDREDEAKLVNKLRKNSNTFIPELSLVATTDQGDIVGYILFVKIKIDHHKSLGLAPLSVIPTHQKLGAGKTLVKEGLKRATELGYRSVIVLGHADYYSKFGFEPARHWNITCPFTLKNDDVFKAIELVPNGLEGVSGTVIYSNEFMK